MTGKTNAQVGTSSIPESFQLQISNTGSTSFLVQYLDGNQQSIEIAVSDYSSETITVHKDTALILHIYMVDNAVITNKTGAEIRTTFHRDSWAYGICANETYASDGSQVSVSN